MSEFEYGALVLGYKRVDEVVQIIESCIEAKVRIIYVSVDGSKPVDSTDLQNNQDMRQAIRVLEKEYPGRIVSFFRNENVGCAVSVLTSIDWFFSENDYGVILEDDCLPTIDFFKFAQCAKSEIQRRPDVWLACGTQFSPKSEISGEWLLSKYSLTWGWATSREKWNEIRSFIHSAKPETLGLSAEKNFWTAGSNRALRGETDVWDTLLVKLLAKENKLVILPAENLVNNVGDDSFATHDQTDSPWTRIPTGHFKNTTKGELVAQPRVDKWLARNFYRIRLKHVFTPWLSQFRFRVTNSSKFSLGLIERLDVSSIEAAKDGS